ncbi:MAG: hypothetical protein AAGD10_10465 [Myxococcota bacterium]
MLAGRAADRAISKHDGRQYNRGHCFGRGGSGADRRTLGLSNGSKVWSATRDQIPALLRWCREVCEKVATGSDVRTGSGLDFLKPGRGLTEFPTDIVAADWPEAGYTRGEFVVTVARESVLLLDLELVVQSVAADRLLLAVEGHPKARPEYRFALDDKKWVAANRDADEVFVSTEADREPIPLETFFQEHSAALYTSNMDRIEGATLYAAAEQGPFDESLIEEVDWVSSRVNPLAEKPDNAEVDEQSLFDWLSTRLLHGGAEVVVCDDGAGEIADFVSMTREGRSTRVELYHCKAAARYPVPGQRAEDLYEVAAQAVKSIRWADKRQLYRRIEHRHRKTKTGGKFLRGDLQLAGELLEESRVALFGVVIVQPGVGRRASPAMLEILAATDSYLAGADVEQLRVIGSVGS